MGGCFCHFLGLSVDIGEHCILYTWDFSLFAVLLRSVFGFFCSMSYVLRYLQKKLIFFFVILQTTETLHDVAICTLKKKVLLFTGVVPLWVAVVINPTLLSCITYDRRLKGFLSITPSQVHVFVYFISSKAPLHFKYAR